MNALLHPLLAGTAGWLLVGRAAPGCSRAERAGYGLLFGLGLLGTLLTLAGAAGIPLTAGLAWGLSGALLAAAVAASRWRRPSAAGAPAADVAGRNDRGWRAWGPAERLLLALIAALVLLAAWRAGFYPVSAMDAHGYDGRARWIVAEERLDISAWRALEVGGRSNLAYPPVYPLFLALGYWSGAAQGKVIDPLLLAALLLVVGGFLARRVSRPAGLLGAFFLAAAPEFWRHASLGLTNLSATAYIGAALLLLLEGTERDDPRPSAAAAGLLLGVATGIRPEVVVPALALGAVMLLPAPRTGALRPRRFAAAALVPLPSLLLLGLWQLLLDRWLGASNLSALRPSLLPDAGLAVRTLGAAAAVLFNPGLYGWVFWLLALGLVLAPFARGSRGAPDRLFAQAALLTGAVALSLLLLYQQIDPGFGGGGGSYLYNSLKRALFYLLPGAVATGLLSPPVRRILQRLPQ